MDKIWEIFWLTDEPSASQEILCCMELVFQLHPTTFPMVRKDVYFLHEKQPCSLPNNSRKVIKNNKEQWLQILGRWPSEGSGKNSTGPPIHTAVKKSLLLLQLALRRLCCFRRCEPGIFHTFPVHVIDKMWIHLQQLSWQECVITYFLDQQSRVQLFQASRGPWNFVHLRRSPRT